MFSNIANGHCLYLIPCNRFFRKKKNLISQRIVYKYASIRTHPHRMWLDEIHKKFRACPFHWNASKPCDTKMISNRYTLRFEGKERKKKNIKKCETQSNTKCVHMMYRLSRTILNSNTDCIKNWNFPISNTSFNSMKSALSVFLNYVSNLVTQHLINPCDTLWLKKDWLTSLGIQKWKYS